MSGMQATDFKIPITGRMTRKRRAFIKKMEEEKRREEDRKKMKDEEETLCYCRTAPLLERQAPHAKIWMLWPHPKPLGHPARSSIIWWLAYLSTLRVSHWPIDFCEVPCRSTRLSHRHTHLDFLEDDSPFRFFGHLAESDDDGIVIDYTSRGLVAYKDATLERAQELKELHKALPSMLIR